MSERKGRPQAINVVLARWIDHPLLRHKLGAWELGKLQALLRQDRARLVRALHAMARRYPEFAEELHFAAGMLAAEVRDWEQ